MLRSEFLPLPFTGTAIPESGEYELSMAAFAKAGNDEESHEGMHRFITKMPRLYLRKVDMRKLYSILRLPEIIRMHPFAYQWPTMRWPTIL